MTVDRRTFLAACAGAALVSLSLPPPRPARPPPPVAPQETCPPIDWALIAEMLEAAQAHQRWLREASVALAAVLETWDGAWSVGPVEGTS